jgi:hypothetical protein
VVTAYGVIMRWLQHRGLLWCCYGIGGYYDVVTVCGVIMMWLQYWELL